MGETGKVKDREGDFVLVSITRTEACAKCNMCTKGFMQDEMEMRAKNECGAQIGDNVEIDLKDGVFLKAAIIMYGLPVLVFITAIIGSYSAFDALGIDFYNEGLAFLVSVVLTFLTYLIIRKNEDRFKKGGYTPSAVRVVTDTPE